MTILDKVIAKIEKNNFSDLILLRDNDDKQILRVEYDKPWNSIDYASLSAKVHIHIKLNGEELFLISVPAILKDSTHLSSYVWRRVLPKYMADLVAHRDDIIKAIESLAFYE